MFLFYSIFKKKNQSNLAFYYGSRTVGTKALGTGTLDTRMLGTKTKGQNRHLVQRTLGT